jgi:hypothetical protein
MNPLGKFNRAGNAIRASISVICRRTSGVSEIGESGISNFGSSTLSGHRACAADRACKKKKPLEGRSNNADSSNSAMGNTHRNAKGRWAFICCPSHPAAQFQNSPSFIPPRLRDSAPALGWGPFL